MNDGLTSQLAQFAAGSGALELSAAVRTTVRNGFIDTVAVMLAGRGEPVTHVLRRVIAARRSEVADARILLGDERASARDAALINAAAGHALDYDDVGLQGHPSVVLVPALLAEGERLGASGLALMRAYVVGYEVWAELISRDEDLHHLKGWHPTGVFGPVATAAAVASLRGLDALTCRHAIALAASMSAGLVANFGSMAKPFHAGQAAAHGIDAVDFAVAGLTGAADVIERPTGFLAAVSLAGRVNREPLAGPLGQSLGKSLHIARLGLTVKKYPMCFATHRVLDATIDLADAHNLQPADVRAVYATVGIAQAAMLRNHRPTNALEAKFSLEFGIASSVIARRTGLAELDDDFVRSASVQSFLERVQIEAVAGSCAYEPSLAPSDRVVIELNDGTRLDSGEIAGARGDARTPLAAHELKAKFMDCCAHADYADAPALFDSLMALDTLRDVRTLAARAHATQEA